ncbi:MAG: hypothetical protein AAFU78_22390 [Cyanobacteria bacterium J06633_2]
MVRNQDRSVHTAGQVPGTSSKQAATLSVDESNKRTKNSSYRIRLARKAEALLNRKGDRPLRNQQRRIINRWQSQQGRAVA